VGGNIAKKPDFYCPWPFLLLARRLFGSLFTILRTGGEDQIGLLNALGSYASVGRTSDLAYDFQFGIISFN